VSKSVGAWALVGLAAAATPAVAQPQRATVVVNLPADARLFVEGRQCPLPQAPQRKFATPPLDPGGEYEYEVRAEVEHDTKWYGTTQKVAVRAGKEAVVTFGNRDAILVANGVHAAPPKVVEKVVEKEVERKTPGPALRFVLARLTPDDKLLWLTDAVTPTRVTVPLTDFDVFNRDGPLASDRAADLLPRKGTAPCAVAPTAPDKAYWAALAPETFLLVPKNDAVLAKLPTHPLLVAATAAGGTDSFEWTEDLATVRGGRPENPISVRQTVRVAFDARTVGWETRRGDPTEPPARTDYVLVVPRDEHVGAAARLALNPRVVVARLPKLPLDGFR